MGDEGVSQLVESFPEGVVVDPARTEKYRHDWARYLPAGRPIAVGLPEPTRTPWSPSGVVPRGPRLDLPARARRHDGPQRTVAGHPDVPVRTRATSDPAHGTHRRPTAPPRQPRDDVRGQRRGLPVIGNRAGSDLLPEVFARRLAGPQGLQAHAHHHREQPVASDARRSVPHVQVACRAAPGGDRGPPAPGVVVLPRPVHPGQPRVRGRPHRLRDRCNPRPPATAGVRS
jgi:hypothetical protein